jgi:hypothetical protein
MASAPPLIEQINNGNWLAREEAEALRDELFYQRAIHAYMVMQPVMNTIGMRDGSEKAFGAGYNVLPIWFTGRPHHPEVLPRSHQFTPRPGGCGGPGLGTAMATSMCR